MLSWASMKMTRGRNEKEALSSRKRGKMEMMISVLLTRIGMYTGRFKKTDFLKMRKRIRVLWLIWKIRFQN